MHGFWYALHVGCAALSVTGFVLRGALMLVDSPLRRAPLVRVAPHVVDTLLLVAAVALAVTLRQAPFADAWLTAKLGALLAYIGLGLVAFRFGRTRTVRAAAFAGALLAVAYLIAVALARDPLPLP
jgi:uncharacterized membrane protein SirB2